MAIIAGSDPPPNSEQTFADVLNALTFGSKRAGNQGMGNQRTGNQRVGGQRTRRGRRAVGASQPDQPAAIVAVPPAPAPARALAWGESGLEPDGETIEVNGATDAGAPDAGAPDAGAPDAGATAVATAVATENTEAAIVRPYAWTRGRTRSAVELQVETLVSTADPLGAFAPPEQRRIAELCLSPRSVAEVAAALAVPLGVAKVLIGDLATGGALTVHGAATLAGSREHLMLMERVLSGLRRL